MKRPSHSIISRNVLIRPLTTVLRDKPGSCSHLPVSDMTSSTYPGLQNSQSTQQYSDSVLLFLLSSRSDINRLKETKAQKRMKEDHTRTLNDWQRMNLTELKVLPEQSRYQVKKAIMSYLGTSKGSNRALKPLLSELSAAE